MRWFVKLMVICTASSKLFLQMTATPDPHELEALVHGEPASYTDVVRLEQLALFLLEAGSTTVHKWYGIESSDGARVDLSVSTSSECDAGDVSITLASPKSADAELMLHYDPSGQLVCAEFPHEGALLDELDTALASIDKRIGWDLQEALTVQFLSQWMDGLQGRRFDEAPPATVESADGTMPVAEFIQQVVDVRAQHKHYHTHLEMPIGDNKVLLLEQNDVFSGSDMEEDSWQPPLRIGIYCVGEDQGVSYARDISGDPKVGPLAQIEGTTDENPDWLLEKERARQLSFVSPRPKDVLLLREAVQRAIILNQAD